MMIGAYLRVSTLMQGDSLDNQKEKAVNFAKEMNQEIDILHDTESGNNDDRNQWNLLLKGIVNDKYDTVWVNDFDRSTRSPQDSFLLWNICEGKEVNLYEKEKKIDYSRDYAMYGVKAVFSSAERRKIIERVKEGKAYSINKGRNTFRELFGYDFRIEGVSRKNKPIRKWYPVDSEVKIIQKVYDLLLIEKMPITRIALHLNEFGYRTKQNKKWQPASVRNIFKHIEYTGKTYNKNKEIIDSQIYTEEIIPLTTYHKVQTLWEKQVSSKQAHKGRPANHIASGVLKCKHCLSSYFWHDGGRGYYNYYHNNSGNCTSQKNKTPSALVIDWIMKDLFYNAMCKDVEDIYNKLKDNLLEYSKKHLSDIENLECKIKDSEKRMINLMDLYEAGGEDDENVLNKYLQRKNEKEEYELKVHILKNSMKEETDKISTILANFSKDKINEFDKSTDAEKRAMIKSIVSTATIDGNILSFTLIDSREYVYDYKESMKKQRREVFELKQIVEFLKSTNENDRNIILCYLLVNDFTKEKIEILNEANDLEDKEDKLIVINRLIEVCTLGVFQPNKLSADEIEIVDSIITKSHDRIEEAQRFFSTLK